MSKLTNVKFIVTDDTSFKLSSMSKSEADSIIETMDRVSDGLLGIDAVEASGKMMSWRPDTGWTYPHSYVTANPYSVSQYENLVGSRIKHTADVNDLESFGFGRIVQVYGAKDTGEIIIEGSYPTLAGGEFMNSMLFEKANILPSNIMVSLYDDENRKMKSIDVTETILALEEEDIFALRNDSDFVESLIKENIEQKYRQFVSRSDLVESVSKYFGTSPIQTSSGLAIPETCFESGDLYQCRVVHYGMSDELNMSAPNRSRV